MLYNERSGYRSGILKQGVLRGERFRPAVHAFVVIVVPGRTLQGCQAGLRAWRRW